MREAPSRQPKYNIPKHSDLLSITFKSPDAFKNACREWNIDVERGFKFEELVVADEEHEGFVLNELGQMFFHYLRQLSHKYSIFEQPRFGSVAQSSPMSEIDLAHRLATEFMQAEPGPTAEDLPPHVRRRIVDLGGCE